jgi:hypothetical protein
MAAEGGTTAASGFSAVRQQAVFAQFGKHLSVLGDCILMVLRL